jgi:hypothetical protein
VLPLIHLALAGVLISNQESQDWSYVRWWNGDKEVLNPSRYSGWDIEYRPPIEVKAMMGAELPADVLVGWYRHPPGRNALLQLTLVRFTQDISVKPRIIGLDCLFILTICLQWWALGRWIDSRGSRNKQRRWVIPAAVITLAEGVAAAFSHAEGLPDLIASLAVILALIAWLVLLGMLVFAGISALIRVFRRSCVTP